MSSRWRKLRHPRALGFAIVTVAFLGAVVGGVGAPLITSVALDQRVSLDAAQWTLTVTLFAGAISAPVLGRLGAGPHRRATIRITLALVAAGGLLTAIPLPFGVLLVARALQGLGLGTGALLMSVARDRLPPERAHVTIATVSVASTVGIGIAYPLMGLIDQLAGLRVAYGVGFLLSLVAVLIAWRTIPQDAPRPPVRVDVPGAMLLGLGTLGVLIVVAQPSVWGTPWLGASVLIAAAIALWAWVVVERRAASPLVNLDLFTKRGVLRANTAMLTSGVGMYLLFSLLTRYVQTPPQAGYGFGLSGALAGAALLPFSMLGFIAGRITPWLSTRVPARRTFGIFAASVIFAAGLFAASPSSLAGTLLAIAVLGLGVGGISAIMPRLVLDGVSQSETSSVLSINQVVRSVGFSIGSALAGLLLSTATPASALFPDEHGYTIATLYVVPLLALGVIATLAGKARTRR
ncbi:MAG: MFS transporter [Microbacterium sp.]